MKLVINLALLMILFSCSQPEQEQLKTKKKEEQQSSEVKKEEFQSFLDSAKLKGAVLIYDLQEDQYYSNDFEWARQGQLPASTFKIPNSIIALETGVVEDDSTLFEWDGERRRMKRWEQDLVFKQAFHLSCVPCYRDVARRIGLKRMLSYLDQFDYGAMVVDSSSLDLFWLQGDSKINQFEQIDFLKRFYQSQLPISERTESIMKNMMVIEENEQYKLSGKTGWSVQNEINNAWFVGFVESKGKVFFFATNVEPETEFEVSGLVQSRKQVTFDALKLMGVL